MVVITFFIIFAIISSFAAVPGLSDETRLEKKKDNDKIFESILNKLDNIDNVDSIDWSNIDNNDNFDSYQRNYIKSNRYRHLLRSSGKSGSSSSKSSKSSKSTKSKSKSSSSDTSRISSKKSKADDCDCEEWRCGDYRYSVSSVSSVSSESSNVNDVNDTSFTTTLTDDRYNYELYQSCVDNKDDLWYDETSCVYCGECHKKKNYCQCNSFMECQWGWMLGFILAFIAMFISCIFGYVSVSGHGNAMRDSGHYWDTLARPLGFALACALLGIIFVVCFVYSYQW